MPFLEVGTYETFDRLCKEKGVTAYRVSQDTGIHQSTFTNWKTGRCTPKTDKLLILAKYFGTTIYEFLGKQD